MLRSEAPSGSVVKSLTRLTRDAENALRKLEGDYWSRRATGEIPALKTYYLAMLQIIAMGHSDLRLRLVAFKESDRLLGWSRNGGDERKEPEDPELERLLALALEGDGNGDPA